MNARNIHTILLTGQRFDEAETKFMAAGNALHKLKFLGNTFISTDDLKEIEKTIVRLNELAAKCTLSSAQKYIEENVSLEESEIK